MGNGNDRAACADIAVIGGGAAGLAAAIAAAEAGGGALRVAVLEAAERAGKPILATGNGRCNFSNARLIGVTEADLAPWYRNAGFAARAMEAAEGAFPGSGGSGGNAVLRFFAEHGLVWREEGEGRLYPLANKASSVLDVLRAAAEEAGVEFSLDWRAEAIERCEDGSGARFAVRAEEGRQVRAGRVIATPGGRFDAGLLQGLGVPVAQQRPVLGPLAVDAPGRRATKRLDNVRVKAAATLLREGRSVRREQGEALFRAYGLSGICIFDLSREALPGDQVALDVLPHLPEGETLPLLESRAAAVHARGEERPTCEDVLRGMVLPAVARELCAAAGARLEDAADAAALRQLARVLRDWRFTVEGMGDERQCQVMRGGVPVESLDAATMEARAVPGLHVAGEAADVDGACGGFNLHWAWASGMLAGQAAARSLAEGR